MMSHYLSNCTPALNKIYPHCCVAETFLNIYLKMVEILEFCKTILKAIPIVFTDFPELYINRLVCVFMVIERVTEGKVNFHTDK